MQTAGIDDKYSRLERFLDKIDEFQDPKDLNEPFRTLWFRIHGVRGDEASKGKFISDIPSDVDLESSTGSDVEGVGKKSSIEILSPSDVGPTLDMKVDEKDKKGKIKFKAASGDELETVKQKEKAAKILVDIRSRMTPLRGMGGEAARLYNELKEIATEYKDGDYEEAMKHGEDMKERLQSEDFRKNLMVYLQKKMKEYKETGADISEAESKFKELAICFKENCDKFIQIAGTTNRMAEDSIKSIVSDVVSDVQVLDEKKKMAIPLKKKVKLVSKSKERKELKSPEEEVEKEREEEEPEPKKEEREPDEEAKPLIKVVKKKITLLPDEEEEEEEDEFVLDEDEYEEESSETDEIPPPKEETTGEENKEENVIDKPEEKTESPPREKIETGKGEKDTAGSNDREELTEAFNKIQNVYNIAVKMHGKGKDVSQLFDLINYAEQARQKGETKTYIGVSHQLENMLLSMQK